MPDAYDEMRDFLTDVFGGLDPEQVWTCAFANPPGNWAGGWGVKRLERLNPDRANFYFCIGEMEPGATRRASDSVVRQHMVVADDVGTKAPVAAWEAMFALGFPEPTFRVETSPGNQTWGWVLDTPVERSDLADWVALGLLRAWLGERGLTDPGVADAARYIRLGAGWNSKPKYVPEGGEPPPVRLIEWVKGRKVSLDALGEALLGPNWRLHPLPASVLSPSLLPASGAGALARTADMNRPEPIIRLAQELGLAPRQVRPGVVEAICPNVAEHTVDGREGTGFSFLGGGLMHCTHGHCQHLRTPDFKQLMIERYNDQVAAQLALGVEVDPKVRDGDGFLLQASLDYHGALSDTAQVEEEVARMVADQQIGAATREMDREERLAALAHRFVWITTLGVFFDIKDRKMFAPKEFCALEDVKGIAPVGRSGERAASSIILNRHDTRYAVGITYKPGEHAAIVEAEDENGVLGPHINTWTPSRVGLRRETPTVWLRVLEHVIPDLAYREWLVKWLAYIIQNPSSRTPLIPLIVSGQGTGKDTFLQPINSIVGHQNREDLTVDRLLSDFNDWARKRLLVLQEVKLDAGGRAYNRIKALSGVSNQRVQINEKHRKGYSVEFVGVFICFTNHEDAIKGIEHDDRRFAPYVSPAPKLETVFTQAEFEAIASDAEHARVRWYLEEVVDLTGFNPYAPAPDPSGSRRKVIEWSMNEAQRMVFEAVTTGEFAERRLFTMREVMDHVMLAANPVVRTSLNSTNARAGLLAAGCLQVLDGKQVRHDGQPKRLWTGRALPDAERDAAAGRAGPATWAAAQVSAVYTDDLKEADERREKRLLGVGA